MPHPRPQGRHGNLALNFPDLAASDFLPWIDEREAAGQGITPDQRAAKTAETWRSGLERAGLGPDEMRQLADKAEVTIYTPGSSAGVPINVIGSLQAPDTDWESDAEIIRDEIESFVSSLLVMADVEADPVSSPAPSCWQRSSRGTGRRAPT